MEQRAVPGGYSPRPLIYVRPSPPGRGCCSGRRSPDTGRKGQRLAGRARRRTDAQGVRARLHTGLFPERPEGPREPRGFERTGVRELLDPASPVRSTMRRWPATCWGWRGRVSSSSRALTPAPAHERLPRLGAAVAGMGRRAAVVDCNLENSQLHRMIGEPNFVGLTSGLEDSKTLEHHGYEVVPGLLVVPTGPILSDPASILENEGVLKAVRYPQEEQGPGAARRAGGAGGATVPQPIRRLRRGLARGPRSRTPQGRRPRGGRRPAGGGVNLLGVVLNGCS